MRTFYDVPYGLLSVIFFLDGFWKTGSSSTLSEVLQKVLACKTFYIYIFTLFNFKSFSFEFKIIRFPILNLLTIVPYSLQSFCASSIFCSFRRVSRRPKLRYGVMPPKLPARILSQFSKQPIRPIPLLVRARVSRAVFSKFPAIHRPVSSSSWPPQQPAPSPVLGTPQRDQQDMEREVTASSTRAIKAHRSSSRPSTPRTVTISTPTLEPIITRPAATTRLRLMV